MVCAAIAGIVCIALLTAVFAAGEVSVIGRIQTRGADIRMKAAAPDLLLSPGKSINYAPIIENAGEAVYVRFRTEAGGAKIPTENFYGFTEDWIKRGDYYYCTRPLARGAQAETFRGFTVPRNYSAAQNEEVQLIQRCDAVQARHFAPDFEADEPWGDVEICASLFNGDAYIRKESSGEPLTLSFQNSGKAEISAQNSADFSLIPGDGASRAILLENQSGGSLRIDLNLFAPRGKLTESTRLDLRFGEQMIYQGSLATEPGGKSRRLGVLPPGKGARLEYSLAVPAELNNDYEALSEEFRLTFTAEKVSDKEKVKTGDGGSLFLYGVVFALAVVAISVAMAIRGKENRNV